MRNERSLLGLDEPHTFFEKLGLFVAALVLGPLIALLMLLVIHVLGPPWNQIAMWVAESLAMFWICVLVFIWWRPPWFRRIYLQIERKVVLAIQIIGLGIFLWLAVVVSIGWCRAMKFV